MLDVSDHSGAVFGLERVFGIVGAVQFNGVVADPEIIQTF
jgi:hypothetical protein